jgi:signal transduction histidine kinase
MLKIGSVRALLSQDPAAADGLLVELETDVETTLAEIRRLVYDLRPPALDQLGLVGAVEEFVAGYGGHLGNADDQIVHDRLSIAVQAPEQLPSLPAAIEVAAYRIAQEGLTNVARHARAKQCTIKLEVDRGERTNNHHLYLEINDDGIGLPKNIRAGIGLTSMRERAEEIGGTFVIKPAAGGGTRLIARLPLITE